MAKSTKKIFVLDTNVLLHDYNCLEHFEENDIVIPITVLEELDKFKKGNEQINFNARELVRELDVLAGNGLFNGGVSLGKGRGKLSIKTGKAFHEILRNSFDTEKPDHQILNIAYDTFISNPGNSVIFVSKDINLRMKAKSIGLMAQDYKSDKVTDLTPIYKDIDTINDFSIDLINELYQKPEGLPLEKLKLKTQPIYNDYFILKNENASILVYYNPFNNMVSRVEKQKIFGIEPRNAEQTYALDALMRPEIELIGLTGKAGTGKTLLALAAALQQLDQYDQILLARPIVPLSNRDLGFLPGTINDKIAPYMQPLYDNLSFIKHRFKPQSKEATLLDDLVKNEKLVISPLAYIRGRSLSNIFFIIDEAQNLTPHEVKTIITRAGEGTKLVFTGDIHQIDSPYLDSQSNGLSYMSNKMKGQKLFTHVNLVKGERSHLAEIASNLL